MNSQKSYIFSSYRTRLTVVCILLVTIPLSIISVFFVNRSYKSMESSMQAQSDQSVQFLLRAFERYFEDIQELTVQPLYNNDLIQTMVNNNSVNEFPLTFNESRQLTGFVTGTGFDTPAVLQVSLYLLNGSCVRSDGMVYRWVREAEPWMDYCDTNTYRSFIVIDDDSIVACRALIQPLYGVPVGYIHIKLNPSTITSLIEDIGLPGDTEVYIYNEFSQFIYPAGEYHEEILKLDLDKEKYTYSIATSNISDLSIVVLMSNDTIVSAITSLTWKLIMLCIAMIFVGWVSAYYASSFMTRPIVKLKDKMKLVAHGRFDTRMTVGSNDEIGQLEAVFNSMTENIEKLIREVYDVTLAGKEAQISALQSQINPHFLYNTLETINMMAISSGNYEISDAVSNLGSMMRYCVSNEYHFATLEEEFQFVNAYYDIQKLRNDNLRSLTIECPPEYRELMIPKLLLQPFVENIIQHGLGNEDVDIRIETHMDGDDVLISIENTGLPLTAESKKRIRMSFSEMEKNIVPDSKSGKGYGLANVHRRLRLLYGDQYGISLDETYTNGARFVLRMKREE